MAYCGGNSNITGYSLTLEQVKEIIYLLKNTNLTQEEIGEKFGITGKNIQPINTGLHWHILTNEEYPIRERYFRSKSSSISVKNTVYDTLPTPEEVLIKIATIGFEASCTELKVCRKTLKKHLANANLPTSKKDIVEYYHTYILKEIKTPKIKMSTGAVQQIDKNTLEILAIYNNSYEAGRALGDENKRKHINEVCQGKRKSAYGFI